MVTLGQWTRCKSDQGNTTTKHSNDYNQMRTKDEGDNNQRGSENKNDELGNWCVPSKVGGSTVKIKGTAGRFHSNPLNQN